MAKKYITNSSSVINWDEFIDSLNSVEGRSYGYETEYEYPSTLERIDENGNNNLEYDYLRDPQGEINRVYAETADSLEFISYTRDNAYGKDVDRKIGSLLGCKVFLSWVSKVNPGKCVAPHIDDEEIYFANSRHPKEKLVRYHIHISKPSMGAAFFIGDDAYHAEEQGSVFQWPAIDSIHCGMNAGVKPKFLYHALGVIDE